MNSQPADSVPKHGEASSLGAALRSPIRIVIADDHPVVRIGVRNMLAANARFQVVSEANDGEDAVLLTTRLVPDILLMDVEMPRLPGIDALRALTVSNPRVKIVLLTGSISPQQIAEAVQIGA